MDRSYARWIGVAEASKILGVHSSTLRQWTAQGRLRAFLTPGGHRRYHEADLQALRARPDRVGLSRLLASAILTAQPRCGLSGAAASEAYAWLGLSPAAAIEAFAVCRAPIVQATQRWADEADAVDALARVTRFFDAALLSMVAALEDGELLSPPPCKGEGR